MGCRQSKQYMSQFQNQKVTLEYRQFFGTWDRGVVMHIDVLDFNKDGTLTFNDFEEAKAKICKMSGWQEGDERYKQIDEIFQEMWDKLARNELNEKVDEISEEKWCSLWDTLYFKIETEKQENPENYEFEPPLWLERYIDYKFSLLDRTGDGIIDSDEYEYVMEDFGVRPKIARTAYSLFSMENTLPIDKATYRRLCIAYFLSNNVEEPGNFISGTITFDEIETNYNPIQHVTKKCCCCC